MKYSLRSLMIMVMIAPPLLALTTMAVWSWVVSLRSQGHIEEVDEVTYFPHSSIPGPVRPARDSSDTAQNQLTKPSDL